MTASAKGPGTGQAPLFSVLLADDDELNLDVVTRMLARIGGAVEAVGNGEDAVARALAAVEGGKPFDLVILDLGMPLLGGREAARRIADRAPGALIVALTGSEEDAALYEAGFSGFLQKPITIQALKESLARWLPALR
ncbi:MAG: response regulator [Spirochaetaceae bacterium]|nr:response regulator [Spirochaetaceae bacterium]